LLVDDDPAVLRAIGNYFESIGTEVYRASSAAAGLEAYERARPDVVILDMGLPDANGLEVLEHLRGQGVAVIMLTGQGDIETAVRAMQLGAENFLTKPIDMPHLAAATTRVAEKVRLKRQNQMLRARDHAGESVSVWASHRRWATWDARSSCWRRASGPPCCSRARAAPAKDGWRTWCTISARARPGRRGRELRRPVGHVLESELSATRRARSRTPRSASRACSSWPMAAQFS